MRKISDIFNQNTKPFIIAELSGNHNNSLNHCMRSIEAAADCGVDAIKFQTYKASSLTIDCSNRDFLITDTKSPWYGKKLYNLYKIGSTPWEWHKNFLIKQRNVA